MRIQARLGRQLQCAITDGSAGTRAAWLLDRCAQLGAAEVDLLIVRERQLEPAALVRFARDVVAVAGEMRVLLAASPDLAKAAGAAGVHLSASRGDVTGAREEFAGAYLSRSCHTVDEVRRARQDGADAVLFGPVFGKSVDGVEVVPGVGLEALAAAVEAAGEMPVFALGGVTLKNAGLCQSAGIAAIRMFFS